MTRVNVYIIDKLETSIEKFIYTDDIEFLTRDKNFGESKKALNSDLLTIKKYMDILTQ